jgi:hypothetical protein
VSAETETGAGSETESMFSAPSVEFVQHATRELGYAERTTVHKMSGGPGNVAVDVYNFPEMVNALFGTRWDRLLAEGSKESFVWVDFDGLVAWLRDVVGDPELADAVAAAVADEDSYKEHIDAITPLFRERVAQYQDVLLADKVSE